MTHKSIKNKMANTTTNGDTVIFLRQMIKSTKTDGIINIMQFKTVKKLRGHQLFGKYLS